MNNDVRAISITGEEFIDFRKDADAMLQSLIRNMYEKGTSEGTITMKVDVKFIKEAVVDSFDGNDNKHHTALKPQFDHTINYSMQVKNKISGSSYSDMFETVYDEETKKYVLRPIYGAEQMSIFDLQHNESAGTGVEQGERVAFAATPQTNEPEQAELPLLEDRSESTSPEEKAVIDVDADEVIDNEHEDPWGNFPDEDFDGYGYDEADDIIDPAE